MGGAAYRTAGGCCDGNPVKSDLDKEKAQDQVLPLSSQSPPYCERQACGGMKLVAHRLHCTCCLSHSATATRSPFF